ncbi:hypothetical protein V1520DRAFT_353003 [Lipomyces starkeyi]
MQSRFTVVFSTGHTRNDFQGRWSQSSKTPDGDMLFTSLVTANTGAAIIIEVGFSESVRRLARDAETWLIGLRDEVRVCIIITLDEQPAYLELYPFISSITLFGFRRQVLGLPQSRIFDRVKVDYEPLGYAVGQHVNRLSAINKTFCLTATPEFICHLVFEPSAGPLGKPSRDSLQTGALEGALTVENADRIANYLPWFQDTSLILQT